MKIVVTTIITSIRVGEDKNNVVSELATLYSINNSSFSKLTDTVKEHKNCFLD